MKISSQCKNGKHKECEGTVEIGGIDYSCCCQCHNSAGATIVNKPKTPLKSDFEKKDCPKTEEK